MYFVAMLVVVLVYGLFVVSMTNAVWDGTLEPGLRRSLIERFTNGLIRSLWL